MAAKFFEIKIMKKIKNMVLTLKTSHVNILNVRGASPQHLLYITIEIKRRARQLIEEFENRLYVMKEKLFEDL